MTDIFKNKTPDFNKLIEYGFSDNGDFFEYPKIDIIQNLLDKE